MDRVRAQLYLWEVYGRNLLKLFRTMWTKNWRSTLQTHDLNSKSYIYKLSDAVLKSHGIAWFEPSRDTGVKLKTSLKSETRARLKSEAINKINYSIFN